VAVIVVVVVALCIMGSISGVIEYRRARDRRRI
jgi:hypothetical protein